MAVELPYISNSRATTFLNCPHSYELSYILGAKESEKYFFSFGSCIHGVLEEFGNQILSKGPVMGEDELLSVYDKGWLRGGFLSAEQEQTYYEKGKEYLKWFRQDYIETNPKPLFVEKELLASLPNGVKLKGILDRVDMLPDGTLKIIDYKTTVKLSQSDVEKSQQLTAYQWLLEQNYHSPVSQLELTHLPGKRHLVSQSRSSETIEGVVMMLVSVSEDIMAGKFEPTPGPQCRRCQFEPICKAWHGEEIERDYIEGLKMLPSH